MCHSESQMLAKRRSFKTQCAVICWDGRHGWPAGKHSIVFIGHTTEINVYRKKSEAPKYDTLDLFIILSNKALCEVHVSFRWAKPPAAALYFKPSQSESYHATQSHSVDVTPEQFMLPQCRKCIGSWITFRPFLSFFMWCLKEQMLIYRFLGEQQCASECN